MATTITFDEVIWYENGVTPASSRVVGYESASKKTRIARFSFTTPPEGGNHISFSVGSVSVGQGSFDYPILFYIGDDPNSHADVDGNSIYHGVATFADVNKGYWAAMGEADILLLPNKTYYLWFFPNLEERQTETGETIIKTGGWFYWYSNSNVPNHIISSGAAGLVKIDTGSGFVNAIPYIDTGSEWKQAIPYIDNGNAWQICG